MNNSDSKTTAIGYRDVLGQTQYMKLLVADAVNRFGDSVDSITFTWLVYALTQSASWSAVIFGLNQIPTVLVQPFAAAWVEKTDRKKVMAVTDALRGFFVLALAAAYIFHVLMPWLMIIFTLAISTAEAFRIPAGNGMIPQLIELKYYSFGSALSRTVSTIMQLIGTGLSGIILAGLGIPAAIIIDMLSYFISAAIIQTIRPLSGPSPAASCSPEASQPPKMQWPFEASRSSEASQSPEMQRPASAFRSWWLNYQASMRQGLHYVKNHPLILKLCFLGITANAMLVPLNALITPVITTVWGQGAELLGVMNTALTAGMLVGGAIYPYIDRIARPGTILTTGGMILSVNYTFLSAGRQISVSPAAACIAVSLIAFLMGAGLALFSSCFSVLVVKCIDKDYLSRTSGIINAFSTAAMPALSFIVSILALYLPAELILFAGAALGILLFIVLAVKKVEFS